MAIVEVHNITKKFNGRAAVEDISLELKEGEVLGFLGPNGAGKTTTIRILSGIIAPTSGYALIANLRTDSAVEQVHEIIGLLTESPGFYDRLSARYNLEFFGGFYRGIDISKQVKKYLKLVRLWERREDRVGTFSKGMKQKLALARALLHEPKVIFLDEPTAGLDPEAQQDIHNLISNLSKEGRTIFLSTHNLSEAESLCQRIAVVRTRLIALDTARELRQRFFRREIVVELEAPGQFSEAIKKLPFVRDCQQEDNRLMIELSDPERYRPELVKAIVEAGGRIISVSEKQHPLEEIYLKLVHEEGVSDR